MEDSDYILIQEKLLTFRSYMKVNKMDSLPPSGCIGQLVSKNCINVYLYINFHSVSVCLLQPFSTSRRLTMVNEVPR